MLRVSSSRCMGKVANARGSSQDRRTHSLPVQALSFFSVLVEIARHNRYSRVTTWMVLNEKKGLFFSLRNPREHSY